MFLIKFDLYLFYQNETIILKIRIMKTLAINPELLSDNNTFSFSKTVKVPTPNHPEWQLMMDVYYKGQRIAILNGLSAPLQWTAKNGSNIPVKVIDKLEKLVSKLIEKTNKSKNTF